MRTGPLIRKALALLQQGQVLGIFPEGTRSKTGALLPPSVGAAYIAVKSQAPVCPVAVINGKRGLLNLYRKFTLRIGSAIRFNDSKGQDLDSIAEQMMCRIQVLLDAGPA